MRRSRVPIGWPSVTIPDSITSIEGVAFYYCSKLTSVYIPAGITYIGWSAFAGCENLKDVYYGGSESQWKGISFFRVEDDMVDSGDLFIHQSKVLHHPAVVVAKPRYAVGAVSGVAAVHEVRGSILGHLSADSRIEVLHVAVRDRSPHGIEGLGVIGRSKGDFTGSILL